MTRAFPRTARLLKPEEFDATFQLGRRERGRFFMAVVRPNGLDGARIGFAVGKKHLPAAHDRNLVKRIGREAFRAAREHLPAIDIVVAPGREVSRGDRISLRGDLDALLLRLQTAAAAAK